MRATELQRAGACGSSPKGGCLLQRAQSGRRRAGACTYRSARTRERSFTGRGAHAQAHVSGSAWASAWAGEELKTQVLGVRVQGIGFTVYGLRFGDEGLAGAGFSNYYLRIGAEDLHCSFTRIVFCVYFWVCIFLCFSTLSCSTPFGNNCFCTFGCARFPCDSA